MAKEKISSLKTSELLDRLNIESNKKEADDNVLSEIEQEIDRRGPFKYIESRIEGNEDGEGLRKQIEKLQEEIKDIKSKMSNHDHKDGKVVIKL